MVKDDCTGTAMNRAPLYVGESWSAELVDLDAFAQVVLDILRAQQEVETKGSPTRTPVKSPRRRAAEESRVH